ncbi:PQQ-dependent sugar dehydrogenase [Pontibacter flavimaris]|uniref:L-sorbosone dehydrogenase n=1 Tax=Pontibacter flavimaris TaxID=1797110 RepID=A0A1Q5PBB5_9BACT|nr:sorbosone dehydrogenase family protein [Pontibacter flavimaris]OKL39518.1 L-sorbosone dehydrogenase [Pontibacter flavimaris]
MKNLSFFIAALVIVACNGKPTAEEKQKPDSSESELVNNSDTLLNNNDTQLNKNDTLPPPYATKSVVKTSKEIGWPAGKTPVAPEGFTVSRFAEGLQHPRWIYVAANGDVFVSQGDNEKSANNILLFRDANKDGTAERKSVYLSGLNMPLGMVILDNKFYVANNDALIEYPYTAGATSIKDPGKKIVSLPGGKRHWTRNVVASKNGDKFYISVGAASNIAENGLDKEEGRALILEVNKDGSGKKVYASGLRNPVGMDWAPGTNVLWTSVNERDELGDNVPPDYLTSVQEGGFYGWPYAYWGQNEDPRFKGQKPDLVQKSIKPDVSLGPHTASLGLTFYTKENFPEKYRSGAFVGQHGSWNRSKFSGYKVVFVPFANGKPTGAAEDFLTGFIANEEKSEVYGRPVGVAVAADGSLLVADDGNGANIIWKVSYKK